MPAAGSSLENTLPPGSSANWLSDFLFCSMLFNFVGFIEQVMVNFGRAAHEYVLVERAIDEKQSRERYTKKGDGHEELPGGAASRGDASPAGGRAAQASRSDVVPSSADVCAADGAHAAAASALGATDVTIDVMETAEELDEEEIEAANRLRAEAASATNASSNNTSSANKPSVRGFGGDRVDRSTSHLSVADITVAAVAAADVEGSVGSRCRRSVNKALSSPSRVSQRLKRQTTLTAKELRKVIDPAGEGLTVSKLAYAPVMLKRYVKLPLLVLLSYMRFLDVYFRFLFPAAYVPFAIIMFSQVDYGRSWSELSALSKCVR